MSIKKTKTTRIAIFDLIAALSSSEKAYFKKFAYKYEKDESVLYFLFDCIADVLNKSSKNLDEAELIIKKKFQHQFPKIDFVKTKHLLFNALLDSLRNFSKKNQDDEYYFESISKSNLLSDKNLFPSAIKSLEKSLKKSQEQELPYMELLVLFKLNLLYIKTGDLDLLEKNLNEQLDALKGVESKIKYAMKYDKVYQIFRTKGILKVDDLKSHRVLDEIYTELSTWDISNASGKTVFNHYMINQLIAYVKGDSKNSLRFSELSYQIAKENFHLFKGREVFIYGILSNLMNDALLLGDYSFYERYLQDLKKTENLNENVITHNSIQSLKVQLRHGLLTDQPECAFALADEYAALDQYASVQNRISIRTSLVHAFFMLYDFKKANIQIVHLIELLKQENRLEDKLKLELLQLLIYVETKNFELLEYRIRSLEQRLKNEKQLQVGFELLMLLIKEIMLDEKISESAKKYEKAYQTLIETNFDQDKTSFSFSCWIGAKLNGISYRDSFKANSLLKH